MKGKQATWKKREGEHPSDPQLDGVGFLASRGDLCSCFTESPKGETQRDSWGWPLESRPAEKHQVLCEPEEPLQWRSLSRPSTLLTEKQQTNMCKSIMQQNTKR